MDATLRGGVEATQEARRLDTFTAPGSAMYESSAKKTAV